MPETPLVAGVELGGTKCLAVLARGTDILDEVRVPTTTPGETLGALAVAAWAGRGAAAVGVGSFGPIALDPAREDYGRMLATPKPGWEGADVLGAVRGLGVPIALDTDVGAAALAEGRWGAAKGCGTHAYVTVGTGIGVGLVANGATVRGFLHPEFGHLRVRRVAGDAFAGICPWHGDCLEGLASGPAVAARAGRAGDTLAPNDPVWERVAGDLAEMVVALLLAAAPERIVFGGGVGLGQAAHLLPRVRAGVASRLNGYLPLERAGGVEAIVVPAGLGDRAGPLGCVALALGVLGL